MWWRKMCLPVCASHSSSSEVARLTFRHLSICLLYFFASFWKWNTQKKIFVCSWTFHTPWRIPFFQNKKRQKPNSFVLFVDLNLVNQFSRRFATQQAPSPLSYTQLHHHHHQQQKQEHNRIRIQKCKRTEKETLFGAGDHSWRKEKSEWREKRLPAMIPLTRPIKRQSERRG